MRFPFSSVLADIVMDDLEKDRIENLDFEVPVYLQYINDIPIVVSNGGWSHSKNLQRKLPEY